MLTAKSAQPATKFAKLDQSTFSSEIKNWVSIGLSRAKSRPPVRISSLMSSQFGMLTRQSPGWGLGWGLEDDGLFYHNGSSGTSAWADPRTGVIGILFFQVQDAGKTDPLQAQFRTAVRAALAE